jgi:hypothetical protein
MEMIPCILSAHNAFKPEINNSKNKIVEIPVIYYCRDTFMTSKSIKLRKLHKVASFPPKFLERIHTISFMPMRKEILIHQSLGLK